MDYLGLSLKNNRAELKMNIKNITFASGHYKL